MEMVIMKSGSRFEILAHTNAVYLAAQYIENKLISYEVGKLRISRGFDGDKPPYFSIPSVESFGRNGVDYSVPKVFKHLAFEHYDKLKGSAIPPKGWEEVVGEVGEVDLRV
jgi:hypothetical protein